MRDIDRIPGLALELPPVDEHVAGESARRRPDGLDRGQARQFERLASDRQDPVALGWRRVVGLRPDCQDSTRKISSVDSADRRLQDGVAAIRQARDGPLERGGAVAIFQDGFTRAVSGAVGRLPSTQEQHQGLVEQFSGRDIP